MRPYGGSLDNPEAHRHSEPEMMQLEEEFKLWYFDPFKTGTVKDWAKEHKVSYKWAQDQKKKPSFISMMEEFRKTYRDMGDEALQNLIRFSHDESPKVAIPAIKILMDVLGYNAPQRVEITTRGMTLSDYLQHIQSQDSLSAPQLGDSRPALAEPALEGEFHYAERESVDVWETTAA